MRILTKNQVIGVELSNQLFDDVSSINDMLASKGFRLTDIKAEYPAVRTMPPMSLTISSTKSSNGQLKQFSTTIHPNSLFVIESEEGSFTIPRNQLQEHGLILESGEVFDTTEVEFLTFKDFAQPTEFFNAVHSWCIEQGLGLESFNIHGNSYSICADGLETDEFGSEDILILAKANENEGVKLEVHTFNSLNEEGYLVDL